MERTPNVLIVDDNEDMLNVFRLLLAQTGCHCSTATSGGAALDAVGSQPPDLIILDVMMPDLDGLEVLKRLKAHAETAGIPIVMHSADHQLTNIMEAVQAGAADYWFKGRIDFAEIPDRVTRLLNGEGPPPIEETPAFDGRAG